MTVVLGLIGLVSLAAVFTAGVFAGRTIASQRQVDAHLRRELRFRDPPRVDVLGPAHDLDEQQAPLPMDLVGDGYGTPSVYVTGGPKLGLTTEEATAGVEALSAALRHRRAVDPATQQLVDQARGIGKCGAPVATSLGTVPCLRDPGHDGWCA